MTQPNYINKNIELMLSERKPKSNKILDYIFDRRIKILKKIYSMKISISFSSIDDNKTI